VQYPVSRDEGLDSHILRPPLWPVNDKVKYTYNDEISANTSLAADPENPADMLKK